MDQLINRSISIRRRRYIYVVVAALLDQLTIEDIRAILQFTFSISLTTDHFQIDSFKRKILYFQFFELLTREDA